MKVLFPLLTSSFICVSCMNQTNGGGSSVDSANLLKNIKATHCEIFIDKAAISETTDPTTGGLVQDLYLFIKIYANRLDSGVRRVRYYGEYTQSSMYGRNGGDNWSEKNLDRQDEAADYFGTKLPLVKLYKYAGTEQKEVFRHSGAFYVESEKGTRYWANAQSQNNFDFNMDFFKGGALPELRILTSFAPTTDAVLNLKKTQIVGELGRFFNPQGCE